MRPFASMRETPFAERVRFFRRNLPYIVGRTAARAVLLAKVEQRAEDIGLAVDFKDEILPCDEDPYPKLWVWGFVKREGGEVLASLGCLAFTGWRDPYVRVVSAELLSEALTVLDA